MEVLRKTIVGSPWFHHRLSLVEGGVQGATVPEQVSANKQNSGSHLSLGLLFYGECLREAFDGIGGGDVMAFSISSIVAWLRSVGESRAGFEARGPGRERAIATAARMAIATAARRT